MAITKLENGIIRCSVTYRINDPGYAAPLQLEHDAVALSEGLQGVPDALKLLSAVPTNRTSTQYTHTSLWRRTDQTDQIKQDGAA